MKAVPSVLRQMVFTCSRVPHQCAHAAVGRLAADALHPPRHALGFAQEGAVAHIGHHGDDNEKDQLGHGEGSSSTLMQVPMIVRFPCSAKRAVQRPYRLHSACSSRASSRPEAAAAAMSVPLGLRPKKPSLRPNTPRDWLMSFSRVFGPKRFLR